MVYKEKLSSALFAIFFQLFAAFIIYFFSSLLNENFFILLIIKSFAQTIAIWLVINTLYQIFVYPKPTLEFDSNALYLNKQKIDFSTIKYIFLETDSTRDELTAVPLTIYYAAPELTRMYSLEDFNIDKATLLSVINSIASNNLKVYISDHVFSYLKNKTLDIKKIYIESEKLHKQIDKEMGITNKKLALGLVFVLPALLLGTSTGAFLISKKFFPGFNLLFLQALSVLIPYIFWKLLKSLENVSST